MLRSILMRFFLLQYFCVQRKVSSPYSYLQCLGCTVNERIFHFISRIFHFIISISFSSFRPKPLPWQLKMVRMFVCVCNSDGTYRVLKHCLKSCLRCTFEYFNIDFANIFLGENRKIFHEQECEKTLITLLASEVRLFLCCQTRKLISMLLKTQR